MTSNRKAVQTGQYSSPISLQFGSENPGQRSVPLNRHSQSTLGTGSTYHDNCGAFEATSSGSRQKRVTDADLAFAWLHNEVYIHSKVMLICRLMISDTNAEGRLYPLI